METLRTLRTVDGITLGYRLTRKAATPRRLIVLMHGVASNMSRWSEFVEHTTLKDNWDVLRLDLRGHGESFVRGGLDLDTWSRDLRDILDAEGYEQALLIGHSLGAQVAVQFAARFPARLLGLVLIDPIFQQALRGSLRVMHMLRPAVSLTAAVIRMLNLLGLRRRSVPRPPLPQPDYKNT